MFWMFLYNLVLIKIWLLVSLVLPFWPRGKTRILLKGRFRPEPLKQQPKAWFHAVSLGEAMILNAVLASFPMEERENFLLTASTHTGMEILKSKNPEQTVHWMPVDTRFCLEKMFGPFRAPDLCIAETEIWPQLYRFIRRSGSRILLFNARIGDKTLKRGKNPLISDTLRLVERFLVRSGEEKKRFQSLGVSQDKISISGNIKFDYLNPDSASGPFTRWLDSGKLIIFSSISNDEVSMLAPIAVHILKKYPETILLWVPRHFDRLSEHSDALEPFQPVRKTLHEEFRGRCVILDTIGELAGTYGHAAVSVIGGSFNQRGGQNFLESLAVGVPAVTGPNMTNFRMELNAAQEKQAVIQVKSPQALQKTLQDLLSDDSVRHEYGRRALDFMNENRGALAKTVEAIRQFLHYPDSHQSKK